MATRKQRSTSRGATIPRRRAWGAAIAAATAVVSGVAIFVNAYGVRAWKQAGTSSATYTTAKNLITAVVLMALFAALAHFGYQDDPPPRANGSKGTTTVGLVAVGVIGGSLPFLLFFEGISRATSTQAALLHKSLLIWVAILAIPLLGERLSGVHWGAIGLIILGQVALTGGIAGLALGSGELMVLAATILWASEVIIAKRLLGAVTPRRVAIWRMGLGSAILVVFIVITGQIGQLAALGGREWLIVLGTSVVLAAYVASWYTALARAQAVDVTAVLVLGALVTAGLRYGFGGVTLPSVVGLGLLAAGTALLVWHGLRQRPTAEAL